MLRTLRAHLISPFLVLGTLEAGLFFISVNIGLIASYADINAVIQVVPFLPQTGFFVATIMVLAFAVGLYNRQSGVIFADSFTRIIVTSVVTFFVLSFFYYIFPQLSLWRSAFAVAFPISFFGWVGLTGR